MPPRPIVSESFDDVVGVVTGVVVVLDARATDAGGGGRRSG